MNASPYDDDELLDRRHLASIADIAFEDFKEILEEVIAEAPAYLDRIGMALAAGERAGGAAATHTFRGLLLNFGCPVMAARLLRFEQTWLEPGEDPVAAAADLRGCWAATRAALERWMGEAHLC